MKSKVWQNLIVCGIFLVAYSPAIAQSIKTEKLEFEIRPEIIGKKVAENVINKRYGWRYQRVCAYYGSMIFSEVTHDAAIAEKLIKGYNGFLKGPKFNLKGHVDYNVFGIWPFEIYR
ncbi:MAG: hypothetical protein KAQ62_14270, partial [Cyclobacteriaceae bacterium]|nr:hypothetical protein [Cyclobacteriaceae bacterium]